MLTIDQFNRQLKKVSGRVGIDVGLLGHDEKQE